MVQEMNLDVTLDATNPFDSGMFSSVTFHTEHGDGAAPFARSASEQVESMHAPLASSVHARPRHPSERSRDKGMHPSFSSENMHSADAFEAEAFAQIGDDLNSMLGGVCLLLCPPPHEHNDAVHEIANIT